MKFALEFDHVTKEYRSLFGRRFRALDSFSLQVYPTEIFGFLGPNGAGKTTAIHLAMGFMRPTSGSGRLLGEPFGHAITRRRVGFLPENLGLYPRPAEQLVRFYGALNGMKASDLKPRAGEVLEMVGLEDHARRNVSRFSRGMLQRVGLAQALVNDPELLILDEPTSALDPVARVGVRELLMKARTQGKTIFLSSHLLSEIELLCDRVAVLHRGQLVRLGRTDELLESYERTEISARGINPNGISKAIAPDRSSWNFDPDGMVRIAVPRDQQRATISRIWEAGGEIISVVPQRRSLEEIFLEVTSGADSRAAGGVQ
ncbi:MAG TPA: ABC transporter ATP-binding protein [Terriglobales bacterium]|nr:ABC transporter ATP-binding protein [Terriglobales bacterium]